MGREGPRSGPRPPARLCEPGTRTWRAAPSVQCLRPRPPAVPPLASALSEPRGRPQGAQGCGEGRPRTHTAGRLAARGLRREPALSRGHRRARAVRAQAAWRALRAGGGGPGGATPSPTGPVASELTGTTRRRLCLPPCPPGLGTDAGEAGDVRGGRGPAPRCEERLVVAGPSPACWGQHPTCPGSLCTPHPALQQLSWGCLQNTFGTWPCSPGPTTRPSRPPLHLSWVNAVTSPLFPVPLPHSPSGAAAGVRRGSDCSLLLGPAGFPPPSQGKPSVCEAQPPALALTLLPAERSGEGGLWKSQHVRGQRLRFQGLSGGIVPVGESHRVVSPTLGGGCDGRAPRSRSSAVTYRGVLDGARATHFCASTLNRRPGAQ